MSASREPAIRAQLLGVPALESVLDAPVFQASPGELLLAEVEVLLAGLEVEVVFGGDV